MRKFLVAAVLALLLAGCETTGTGVAANITTASQTLNQKIASAKAYIQNTCRYVPTTASLIALFNSSLGAAVGTVGDAVCAAVNSAPLADGPANFRVNGVFVKGRFVR